MFSRPWTFQINPFDVASSGSNPNADKLDTFHLVALTTHSNIPYVQDLLVAYQPVSEKFKAAYAEWKKHGGIQTSETDNVHNFEKNLSVKSKKWDVNIQNEFADTTKEYKSLMEHHRAPFQTGTVPNKLMAVKNLGEKLAAYGALAATKAEVDSFYAQFNQAYKDQQGAISISGSHSSDVDEARTVMCDMMYAHLGMIIYQNPTSPDTIGKYFDLSILRKKPQNNFTRHIKGGKTIFLVERSLVEDQILTITNLGNTNIDVWSADQKTGGKKEIFATILAGEVRDIKAQEIGLLEHHYIMVENMDAVQVAFFELYIA
jgi:hypothetical protein